MINLKQQQLNACFFKNLGTKKIIVLYFSKIQGLKQSRVKPRTAIGTEINQLPNTRHFRIPQRSELIRLSLSLQFPAPATKMLQFPAFMTQYPWSTRTIPTSFLLPSQWPQPQNEELLLAMEESDFEEKVLYL